MLGVIFGVFFGTLLIGIPIGVAIGFTCILISLAVPTVTVSLEYMFRNMVMALDSFVLLAVPLFILSGNLMAEGGISDRLYGFFSYFIGNTTGGMPNTAIITCLFYGAISGSAPATVAAVGAMCIPVLVNLGYSKKFVVGMVATAGGLGVIIPPSIPFVMYGLSSTESVGDLFISGIIPGLIIGAIMMVYTYFYCRKVGEDKEKLEANFRKIRTGGLWNCFKNSFLALLCPVIILGGIYSGIFTPTEAADISVIYALIVSVFVYKTMTPVDVFKIALTSLKTIGPIFLICSTATVFGRMLTLMNVPQDLATAVMSAFNSKVPLLLIINLFLLFVGMVMDTLAAILILTPILLPLVKAFGVNAIHFGVIMVVNLAIGFVTPPVGVNLYVASSIGNVSVIDVAKHALPYIICFLFALMAITFIPWISTCIVS
ncbi:MAG: TRAP transporter large permease [Clostridia bacterium]|nr:TRAP transporter large permease [Clostridia bacterium]